MPCFTLYLITIVLLFDVDKGGENADMHKLRGSITHLAKNLPSSKRGSL
jgi:hypothetical protein